MRASFRLGRIAGIEIGVHYTWLFAFILIAWTLSERFFPSYYPEWSKETYWITGILSALLLFASVLVHELAHSFVARSRGIEVQGITLFVFGGVSNLKREPEKARDELVIAIVGPLTSAVLAGAFWGLYTSIGNPDSPLAAILGYLALINGLLAAFNLVPGFPLDGGRVLRSIVWGSTGNIVKATNVAAGVGQLFGWVLIGWGVYQILQDNLPNGLWVAFVGWFLNSAAVSSRKEVAMRELFRGTKVRAVMEKNPESVEPGTSVEEMVSQYFLRRGSRAMPICYGDRLLGIVTLRDVKRVPQERWANTSVAGIMTREPLHSIGPEEYVAEALRLMTEHNINQVLVTKEGKLVGLLNRAHVILYIQGVKELGVSPNSGPDASQ